MNCNCSRVNTYGLMHGGGLKKEILFRSAVLMVCVLCVVVNQIFGENSKADTRRKTCAKRLKSSQGLNLQFTTDLLDLFGRGRARESHQSSKLAVGTSSRSQIESAFAHHDR